MYEKVILGHCVSRMRSLPFKIKSIKRYETNIEDFYVGMTAHTWVCTPNKASDLNFNLRRSSKLLFDDTPKQDI